MGLNSGYLYNLNIHILSVRSLFLSQQTLRRMCYLTIKEMANISEDVIIVTSRFVP